MPGVINGILYVLVAGCPKGRREASAVAYRSAYAWSLLPHDFPKWHFGFKLHLIISDRGELLAFKLTPGNVDDRKPVPEMAQGIFGIIIWRPWLHLSRLV